jgi:hypothetical protein
MKAARSDLAKQILADPSARAQLRNASVAPQQQGRAAVRGGEASVIVVQKDGVQRRYTPVVVPKAA